MPLKFEELNSCYLTSQNFVVRMEVSNDGSKLVCVHCNGDVSLWRLPLLRLEGRWPLSRQPHHRLESPLRPQIPHNANHQYHPADVNWWSEEVFGHDDLFLPEVLK